MTVDFGDTTFVGRQLAAPTIARWGTDEQQQRFLGAIEAGTERWCQLFSEPGSGSDLAGLRTRAERRGDAWVVNGQKVWTSGGSEADFGLLLARTDPDQPKHRGISYFILDMRIAGVDVRPLRQMSGEAHFSEVFLSDVVVPDAMRLGPVNEGWRVAMSTLMQERVSLSGPPDAGSGPVGALIKEARRTDLWADVLVRHRLVGLLIEEQALQMTILRAVEASAAGRAPGPEGSVTKLAQSELLQRVADAAVDLLGPSGIAWEGDGQESMPTTLHQFLSAPAHTIAGGTSEIQRNVIAERVLGLPKEPELDRDVPWREVRR